MIWLKFVHMAAIAIWSAGLICLPGLYAQRKPGMKGPPLHRLQTVVRFLYVVIVSPAAFVAVGTGIGLVFLQETFVPWFSAKLALVGVMVVIHILTGLVIIRLFVDGETYPQWRYVGVTVSTVGVVLAILVVVLAKPDLPALLPDRMSEPGGLADIVRDLNPLSR